MSYSLPAAGKKSLGSVLTSLSWDSSLPVADGEVEAI